MSAETLLPYETPETGEVPGVLSAYNQLTSPDARSAFGDHIAQEDGLLGIERSTLTREQRDLDGQMAELSHALNEDRIPYREFDTASDEILRRRLELSAESDELRRRELFASYRETVWSKGAGGMLFNREDPHIAALAEGLLSGAVAQEQPFMPDSDFTELADDSLGRLMITAEDEPMEFPSSSVVSALGFSSWEQGRGGKDHDKVSEGGGPARKSRAVMEEYAARDTPIPPADAMAIILRDGRVILRASDAHRVGAAKLRGQETIQIKNLIVYREKGWRSENSTTPLPAKGDSVSSPDRLDSAELDENRDVSALGMAIVAVSNSVEASDTGGLAQDESVGQVAPIQQTSRWRRFISGVNYHRKHRKH